MSENIEQNKSSKRKKIVIATIIAIVVIIILLLLRSCGGNTVPEQPTIGDFEITDEVKETEEITEPTEINMLTFVGRGEYTVSAKSPTIELRNSEKNEERGAEFVFTVMDAATGDVIARTEKVAPGQYVYVNVMGHYSDPGDYDLVINIAATDKDGNELNGMNQEATLHVN